MMAENEKDFELERLDQQIEHPAGSLDTNASRLVVDLQRMYQTSAVDSAADTESLQRVQRLLQARQQRSPQETKIIAFTKSPGHHERKSMINDPTNKRKPGWRRFSRALSSLAAILVAALLIGSALVLFNHKPQAQTSLPQTNTGSASQTASKIDCSHVFSPASKGLTDNGEHAVCVQGEETPVHGTITLDGRKITLIAAYADTNRAIVRFSIDGPPPSGINYVYIESLTAQGGQQWFSAGGPDNYTYTKPNQVVELESFEAQNVPANTTSLALTAHVVAMNVPATPVQQLTPGQNPPWETQGTLHFTIPFHSEKHEATPNKTVSINGHAITLEHVVVTDSQTRLFLKSDKNLPPSDFVGMTAMLNGNSNLGVGVSTTAPGDAKQGEVTGWTITMPESLLNQQGTWTLKLTATSQSSLGQGSAEIQFTV